MEIVTEVVAEIVTEIVSGLVENGGFGLSARNSVGQPLFRRLVFRGYRSSIYSRAVCVIDKAESTKIS